MNLEFKNEATRANLQENKRILKWRPFWNKVLTPASHMEVGCPGTWGLELLTPNLGSKSTPKACPTNNPATSPARYTQPQPKHLSHRARSSVEIIITVITNNNNNNNDNNNKVIIIKGRGGWEKTLKHSDQDVPTTKPGKTPTTCNDTGINYNNNR